MEEAFTLRLGKHETAEAYKGRARLVFAKLAKEGVEFPVVARGSLVLQGGQIAESGTIPSCRQPTGVGT